jgi:2-hydroxychromene-2-carboxylate isomerase
MGVVISIDEHRGRTPGPVAERGPEAPESAAAVIALSHGKRSTGRPGAVAGGRPSVAAPPRTSFFVDPASPATYLVAERVERSVAGMRWVVCPPLEARPLSHRRRARLEARAAEMRMPLVWPDRPTSGDGLRRLAASAGSTRVVQAITLAAGRLAFCGGYDLDDPEVLGEIAAGAGLDHEAGRRAALDPAADVALAAVGATARLLGVRTQPAIQVGVQVFDGEQNVPGALAAIRAATFSEGPRPG